MSPVAYLNTRGRERHRDYQFVGPAPPTAWWRAYAEHTTFEHPTVLVQSDGRDWQAYVSGIPSRRRDVVGAVIRYTVVAEGAVDQGRTDPSESGQPGAERPGADRAEYDRPATGGLGSGDVLALVANWLADQDEARGAGQVSAVLDAAFPEPDVERLISAEPDGTGPAHAAEVRRRLTGALSDLQLPDPAEAEPVPEAWLADLGRPAARAAFVQQVDALLAGQPGRALVLNLVGSAADLAALLEDARPLAVLAPDLPGPTPLVALNRQPVKKVSPPAGAKEPESPAPFRPAPPSTRLTMVRNLRGCLRLIMVPIALLLALALALFGALFYLR